MTGVGGGERERERPCEVLAFLARQSVRRGWRRDDDDRQWIMLDDPEYIANFR